MKTESTALAGQRDKTCHETRERQTDRQTETETERADIDLELFF